MARRPELALLLLFASCSTVITPRAVEDSTDWPVSERAEINTRWTKAVRLANDFLQSEDNLSLPNGVIHLHHDSGMSWHHPDGCRPIRVENSWWGDRCVDMGFAAQERSWGFVVGDRGDGPQVIDHSLFYYTNGMMKSAPHMAELILHETAHMVHGVGTVGFWDSVSYYWHAMFSGGGREHPAEQLPYATSDEFLGSQR